MKMNNNNEVKCFFPNQLKSLAQLMSGTLENNKKIPATTEGKSGCTKKETNNAEIKIPFKLLKYFNKLNLPKKISSAPFNLNRPRQLSVEDQLRSKSIIQFLLNDLGEFGTRTSTGKELVVAMAEKSESKKKKKKEHDKGSVKSLDEEKNKKGKKEKKGKKKKYKDKDVKHKLDNGENITIKASKTILKYRLSDPDALVKGVTAIPNKALVMKIITFKSEPAKYVKSCFSSRNTTKYHYYDNKTLAATFTEDGTGFILYPNREPAIELIEGRIGKKLVVYSQTRKDDQGNRYDSSPVAIFDDFGNGAVFDDYGKIRMNYDQAGGVLYDTPSKTPLHWFWPKSHLIVQRKKDLENIEADNPDEVVEEEERVGDEGTEIADTKKEKKKSPTGTIKIIKKNLGPKYKRGEEEIVTKGKKNKEKKREKKKPKKKKKSDKSPDVPGSEHGTDSNLELNEKEESKMDTVSIITRVKHHIPASGKKGANKVMKIASMLELTKAAEQKKRIIPPMTKLPKKLKPITDIKPLVIKIADHIAFRALNQQHIHVDFTIYPVHIRLQIGTIISPEVLERIDDIFVEQKDVRKVPCYFEYLYRRTHSLIQLHSTRKEMIRKGEQERRKQFLKQSLMMGTHIYLKKRKTFLEKEESVYRKISNIQGSDFSIETNEEP